MVNGLTRIFHDWEFYEDGNTIEAISVGMVANTGETYYAIFDNANYWAHKSEWLQRNVYPHIESEIVSGAQTVKTKFVIAEEIQKFITSKDKPELWAWYGAYDHVRLAQTFGAMINMPSGIPWVTHDIKTLELLAQEDYMWNHTKPLPSINYPTQDHKTEHHALYDAMHDRELYDYFKGLLNG